MNHTRLICYQCLLRAAKRVPALVGRLPRGQAYLADQLKRAMASALLNLAEGNGRRTTRERQRFFDIAGASIDEVTAILDIMIAFQIISESEEKIMQQELRRGAALLLRLRNAQ
jgi:four helix bundle protein